MMSVIIVLMMVRDDDFRKESPQEEDDSMTDGWQTHLAAPGSTSSSSSSSSSTSLSFRLFACLMRREWTKNYIVRAKLIVLYLFAWVEYDVMMMVLMIVVRAMCIDEKERRRWTFGTPTLRVLDHGWSPRQNNIHHYTCVCVIKEVMNIYNTITKWPTYKSIAKHFLKYVFYSAPNDNHKNNNNSVPSTHPHTQPNKQTSIVHDYLLYLTIHWISFLKPFSHSLSLYLFPFLRNTHTRLQVKDYSTHEFRRRSNNNNHTGQVDYVVS